MRSKNSVSVSVCVRVYFGWLTYRKWIAGKGKCTNGHSFEICEVPLMNITLDICLAHGTNDNRRRERSRIYCGRIILHCIPFHGKNLCGNMKWWFIEFNSIGESILSLVCFSIQILCLLRATWKIHSRRKTYCINNLQVFYLFLEIKFDNSLLCYRIGSKHL